MESHNSSNQQHHSIHHHHHLHQQQSRPPSVDSVNLGSIYSGFYPQASSTGPSSLGNLQNIPSTSSINNNTITNNSTYHNPYYNYGSNQNNNNNSINGSHSGMPPGYHHQTYNPSTMPAPTASNQQPQSLPPNLSYHYQISAQAAAAAAFGYQNYQNPITRPVISSSSQQQPIVTGDGIPGSTIVQSPTMQNPTAAAAAALYPGLAPSSIVQWPSHQYGVHAPNAAVNAMTNQNPMIMSPTTTGGTATGVPSDYISQYYSQYYREYYQRIVAHHKIQQHLQQQKKIAPYKFNQFHTPVQFSQNNNQLLMIESNYRIGFYGLQEIFTEQLYPHLFLQTLLYDNPELCSNNLQNLESSSSTTTIITKKLLPFNDQQTALDWIRVKQLNDSNMNYELKLILKIITMLFRQNGQVSGLDLSELLFELITSTNDDSEKLSQSGAGSSTKDLYRESISHLRQLLMRGQRRVAIAFAQTNGLFDHALSLTYLLSFLSNNNNNNDNLQGNLGQIIDNGLMISTIRKFINTTLSPDDPLYVFYCHLLQIATNVINTNASSSSDSNNNTSIITTTATTSNAKIDKLESFIILLANEIKFDKVEILDKSYKNLIDLMIALLKNDYDYILPDELFHTNDRFDCLLVNECLEYARFHGESMNPKLILRKLEFAFELFDFGFLQHSKNYLIQIQQIITKSESINWKCFLDKKSKFCKFLLPESILENNNDGFDEKMDGKLLKNIWLYQIMKILNRIDSIKTKDQFDSPLFYDLDENQKSNNNNNDNDNNNNDEDEENDGQNQDVIDDSTGGGNNQDDEDKTDMGGELEDEEVDVETLGTSESQQSNSNLLMKPIQQKYDFNQPQKQQILNNIDQQINTKQNNSLDSTNVVKQPPPPPPTTTTNQSIIANDANNNLLQQPQPSDSLDSSPTTTTATTSQSNPTSIVDNFNQNNQNNNNDQAFKMNSLQSALPNFGMPSSPSSSLNAYQPNNQQTTTTTFFQPAPIETSSTTTSTFDFVSTNGRVQSIPSFDPISFNDDINDNNKKNINQINNQLSNNDDAFSPSNYRNNEFLHNYPTATKSNESLNTTTDSNNKNNQSSTSDGESSKNSPNKANGGLLTALFGRLKPKNQMILPDDKDPQIIYDPVTKRWIDKSASNDQTGLGPGGLPPPPKIPFGGNNNNTTTLNEPNSSSLPLKSSSTLPSFPTFDSTTTTINQTGDIQQSQPQPSIPPSTLMSNGNIPSSSSSSTTSLLSPSNTPFGGIIPTPSTTSGGGGGAGIFRTDIRRKRYIDVFNQQPTTKQQ